MNIKELQVKVKNLFDNSKPKYRLYSPLEKQLLTQTVKLNEEVGELCNDILSVLKLQRKSKLEKFEKKNFYEEFADVIITTIHLANDAGVDLQKAINRKMRKIEKRYSKDH